MGGGYCKYVPRFDLSARSTRDVKCGCQVWQHFAMGPCFVNLRMMSFVVVHFFVIVCYSPQAAFVTRS